MSSSKTAGTLCGRSPFIFFLFWAWHIPQSPSIVLVRRPVNPAIHQPSTQRPVNPATRQPGDHQSFGSSILYSTTRQPGDHQSFGSSIPYPATRQPGDPSILWLVNPLPVDPSTRRPINPLARQSFTRQPGDPSTRRPINPLARQSLTRRPVNPATHQSFGSSIPYPSTRQPGDPSILWLVNPLPVNPATHQSFGSSIPYPSTRQPGDPSILWLINPLPVDPSTRRPIMQDIFNENVTLQHCFECNCYTAKPHSNLGKYITSGNLDFFFFFFLFLFWGLTSQSTIFQSCRDGATASWVINQYFRGVKCLAQGHNTVAVGFEPPTSRSGVRHSTTKPLGECPGWSESSLGKHVILLVLSWSGSFKFWALP